MQYLHKDALVQIIANAALQHADFNYDGDGYVGTGTMIEWGLEDLGINVDYLGIEDEMYESMKGE